MTDAYAYTPTIWPPLVAAIVVAAMGLYAWHRREMPAVKPFVATCLFGCLLVLGVAAQAAAVSPAAKIAWNKYQFLFTVLAVTAGTCFYLEYAYPGRWLTRRNLILLSIVPLLTLILIVVDDARFIWQEFVVAPDGAIILALCHPGCDRAGLLVGPGLRECGCLHLALRPLATAPLARGDHVGRTVRRPRSLPAELNRRASASRDRSHDPGSCGDRNSVFHRPIRLPYL